MKCGKDECKKNAARGQKYCSKDHAPYGKLGHAKESNTKYATTAGFGSRADGGPLRKQLKDGSPEFNTRVENIIRMRNTEKSLKSKSETGLPESKPAEIGGQTSQIMKKESEMQSAQSENEATRIETKNPEHLIAEIEKQGLGKFTKDETDVIPAEKSTGQLLTLEQEKVASMSCIDDVVERLHWQMKRCAIRDHQAPITEKFEVERANLAIKTASTISQMIKLKLSAVKIYHDIRKE